jgi:HSP20 family molecular chaperone IbpA
VIGVETQAMSGDTKKDWMWAEACAVLEQVEQMRRQFFRPELAATQATWQPPVDMFETAEGLWIVAALPGVEARDVGVAIERDILFISGIRHLPALARGAAIQRLEIPYGRFERQVRLPSGRCDLGPPEIANGCLFITLAKHR